MIKKSETQSQITSCAVAEAQTQTESACALPALSGELYSSGAPLSNTAPPNYNGDETYVIRAGVDSLYLSFRGVLDEVVEKSLEELKALAQSADREDRARAILKILSHRFEVNGRGKGRFPYVLSDNWFHIQLSRSTTESLPMAYVQLKSELLSRGGVERPDHMLNLVISKLGNKKSQSISRVDICADFLTDFDLSELVSGSWVTRATKLDRYEVHGKFTGFSFGKGGGMSARLYDKTTELRISKKDWLMPLWAEGGWKGELPVWRIEFQFRRSVLKDLGINDVKGLHENLTALWRYATTQWLRLVCPSATDRARNRWPDHPLWKILQGISFGPDNGEMLFRIPRERFPSDDHIYIHGLGGITSFMAAEGFEDIDDAIGPFMEKAHAHHLRLYPKSGKTLKEYARLKAMEKARKFNKRLRVDPKDRDPKAYLKEKWGE